MGAFCELAFRLPMGKKQIAFQDIAVYCDIPLTDVEFMAMNAMCAELVRGSIDEVGQEVTIDWVKPRILDQERLAVLKSRLEAWANTNEELSKALKAQVPEFVST
eukprot:GHVU01024417.1.p2 GENE.GHVU01024417.1~~GHVU01024417.1.p2  ORF type:complete len:105 (-),score=25.62 GHVU01024417.1:432-746(-)